MFIREFSLNELRGWTFPTTRFNQINLFVGDSGTGKTRYINGIFNVAAGIVRNSLNFDGSDIKIRFEHIGKEFFYQLKINNKVIDFEKLDCNEEIVIDRDSEKIMFKGSPLPVKLNQNSSVLHMIEEEPIKEALDAFRMLHRRDFASDWDNKYFHELTNVDDRIIDLIKKERSILPIIHLHSIHTRMYYLLHALNEYYMKITSDFQMYFPSIKKFRVDVQDIPGGSAPVFKFAEKDDMWRSVEELSSGQKKSLLFLFDFYCLPKSSVYIVDEYENSMGINSIDMLPELMKSDFNKQYFITSHHPYIINNIPIKDWFIFHRNGTKVTIKSGNELEAQYGNSKQMQFTKLVNDPFFNEGIE